MGLRSRAVSAARPHWERVARRAETETALIDEKSSSHFITLFAPELVQRHSGCKTLFTTIVVQPELQRGRLRVVSKILFAACLMVFFGSIE
jgi:hypothetical protein